MGKIKEFFRKLFNRRKLLIESNETNNKVLIFFIKIPPFT